MSQIQSKTYTLSRRGRETNEKERAGRKDHKAGSTATTQQVDSQFRNVPPFQGGEGVHWREFGNAKLRVGCDYHKREGAIKQEVVQ